MNLIPEDRNLWLQRRLGLIDEYVRWALRNFSAQTYDFRDYVEEIIWQVFNKIRPHTTDEETIDMIGDYIKENYWNSIEEKFLSDQK